MSYHPGTCFYPVGFDYSPTGIAEIPVVTIRKFAQLSAWEERFYYVEGDRVRAMQDEGKRILATLTISNDQWATMSDADWARKVDLFMNEVPVNGIEVGNEIGAAQVPAYLPKLKIASDIIRGEGGWVMLSSPLPGKEGLVWDAVNAADGWRYADQIACHPYGKTPTDVLAKLKAFRKRLDNYGPRPAKFGISSTEFGWTTQPGKFYSVDEATQARYVAEAFALLEANAADLDLRNQLYFTFNDGGGWSYGVVRADGTRKPAFAALAAA